MTMENPLRGSSSDPHPAGGAHALRGGRSWTVPLTIVAGLLLVLGALGALVWRAQSKFNNVALASTPKPVTVVAARNTMFRQARTYVGTLRPWIEASVGPQFISAYVDTVLVRPGATVKRNEVLATLDCRNASASSQAVAAEARAIDARQQAFAHESARIQTLLDGGFVSPNEAEQKSAQSAAEEAQLASQRAKLASTRLEVSDCVLRAPFDGEIGVRTIDPGAFVRPGTAIVSVIDRNTVRMTFDVPEGDFDVVRTSTPVSIHVAAIDRTIVGSIARRSPSADAETRTVHVEVDLANSEREIPVNTTGEARIEVGQPVQATAVPLVAASISGSKATLFLVDGDVARKATFHIEGEQGSDLFVEAALRPGAHIVTEGRATLADGDRVASKEIAYGTELTSRRPASNPEAGSPP
jgi:membrane fusion protein, multidrug efflux system